MTLEQLSSIALTSCVATLIILFEVYMWQRKEYRWDRMRAYLFSDESRPHRDKLLFAVFALTAVAWVVYLTDLHPIASLISWGALIIATVRYGLRIRTYGISRPTFTLKSSLTLTASLFLTITTIFLLIGSTQVLLLELATLLVILPVPITLAVVVVRSVGGIRKYGIIHQARRLRASQPNLTVIAITGSVGKTSTKEYLAHILTSAGYTVCKTKKHRNSEFTVAQDLLEQLPTKPDIYIVEAAAYRKGEVAAIVRLVKPRVGVLTSITNQHEGLFGSIEAIRDAKWEIVTGLPSDGIAVLNIDNEHIQLTRKSYTGKEMTFSSRVPADIYALTAAIKPDSISFQLHIRDVVQEVTVPLVGTGAQESCLAAIAAASAIDTDTKKIFESLPTLPQLPRTLQLYTDSHGATILDDSYSASERSVENAIEHLGRFPQSDKRIVLVPIIELGESAAATHQRIGKLLAKSGADVYIYGVAYRDDIAQGAGEATKNIIWFNNAKELQMRATANISSDSVILLEGRIPDIVRQAFTRQS